MNNTAINEVLKKDIDIMNQFVSDLDSYITKSNLIALSEYLILQQFHSYILIKIIPLSKEKPCNPKALV